MEKKLLYLNTYVVQRDMRIRLPKSILTNLNLQKGVSKFDFYLDAANNELVLKIHKEDMGERS